MVNIKAPGLLDHLGMQQRKSKNKFNEQNQISDYSSVSNTQSNNPSQQKMIVFYVVIALIVITLMARLAELQLVKGGYYEASAVKNKTSKNLQVAPRGVIKDSNGGLLAFNQAFVKSKDGEQIYSEVNVAQTDPAMVSSRRAYPCQNACANILGYTSLIKEEEAAAENAKIQVINNVKAERGRTGLEEGYQDILKGNDGFTEYEVNAQGEVLREVGATPLVAGMNLQTSIDQKLQVYIYDELVKALNESGAKGGAVIVMDPRTGNIKALVSAPAYNNNLFTLEKEKSQELQATLTDQRLPLLNRAIGGSYPPGSTYKIITSAALLAEKIVTKDTIIVDTGKIELSGTTFNNWYFTSYGKTDGEVNIVKAMQRSNDTYYYKASLDLGIEKLETWSRNMGLGAVTGIDIPGELKGLVPNPQWKWEKMSEQWYPGNTVNMSIGQGDLLTTPLQVALYTSVVANRGTLVVPSLVQKITDADGNLVCERDSELNNWVGGDQTCLNLNKRMQKPRQVNVTRDLFDVVEQGMLAANSRGGTAVPFFDYPIKTAGKTGTSETQPGQATHAWYTVYAPVPNPQYVVTVLVESGGEGSSVAAPVAKKALDFLLQ